MSHNEPDTMDTSDNNTIGLVDHSSPPQDLIMSTTVTDFARKLFNMLEDPSNQAIVCWGAQRDSFIVKDTNEFAKSILPRVFNHSNFASFVRQLNKYDFHKVKQTEFNQAGEQVFDLIALNFIPLILLIDLYFSPSGLSRR
ncbi:hypothetical protein GALMADRAFT_238545 [Galerina marginata CBS 339.88]|uniref:HSF-type DNA-binding domain-containing protein n=1 Tax=Galerina marginata (strain CBS 339.88) TaxID=685588 RepID=A0A067TI58_GALM3|nr:hypothetical protein GALMADRAFT_238545 [Galerina marginata CBS 339.88]